MNLAQRAAAALCIVAVAAVVALAFAYAFYALPQADDFVLAHGARDQGLFPYVGSSYLEWSGRWSGIGLIAAVLSRGDLTQHYPLLVLLLLAFSVFSSYVLVRTVIGESASRKSVLLVAVLHFAMLWAGRPRPQATLYWFSGAVPYQLSFALAIVVVAILVRPFPPGAGPRRWLPRGLCCSLLVLVIAGLYELMGMALLAVLALGTLIAFRTRSRGASLWLWVLAASVLGLLVVLLAPGNEVRGEKLLGRHDVANTIGLVGTKLSDAAQSWLLDPKLFAATLLFAVHPFIARQRPKWLERAEIPWKWIVPGVWLLILAGGFIGPAWAIGKISRRLLDANYAIFVTGWFLTLFVWTRAPRGSTRRTSVPPRAIEACAWVALALALVTTGNFPTAVSELRDRVPAWHRAVTHRHALARAAREQGQLDLRVPSLPAHPQLLFVLDLSAIPSHFQNRGFASYFGLRFVRLGPPSESPAASGDGDKLMRP